MSYARWSASSSVYVFHHVDGYITCCGCLLVNPDPINAKARDPELYSRSAAIEHLERHLAAGHRVPSEAFIRLRAEIEELSDTAQLGRRRVSKHKERKRRLFKWLRRPRRLKSPRLKSWEHYLKWSRINAWKKITDYTGDPS